MTLNEEEREYVLWNLRNQLPSTFSHSPSSIEKKEYRPFRQIYWEDSQYNPQIISPGLDALPHSETLTISSSNLHQTWGKEKRFTYVMEDSGPSKSLEYPHIYAKPIPHFQRHHDRLVPYHSLASKPKCHRNVCSPLRISISLLTRA
jgi:hypothetical protein